MAIGFTGTQGNLTQAQADALCKALWYYRQWFTVMHNGDCVGADEYAGRYWIKCGGQLWLHPPTVRTKRAFLPASISSSPAPYLRRNMAIVLQADFILATPKEEHEIVRSGTWATVRYARDAGKQVYIIYPSGKVEGHKPK